MLPPPSAIRTANFSAEKFFGRKFFDRKKFRPKNVRPKIFSAENFEAENFAGVVVAVVVMIFWLWGEPFMHRKNGPPPGDGEPFVSVNYI